MKELLNKVIETNSQMITAYYFRAMATQKLPGAKVEDVINDPQIQAREIFVTGPDSIRGPVTYVGLPAIVPGQPFEVTRPAPTSLTDSQEATEATSRKTVR